MKTTDPRFLNSLKDSFKNNGAFYFIDQESIDVYQKDDSSINRLKGFLKRWPAFYKFLRFFSPGRSGMPLMARRAITHVFSKEELSNKLIINIGSGNNVIHPEVINLDLFPLSKVNLIADVRRLPFKNESVDMIICESLLEHVPEPDLVVSEIKRVLKGDGYIYVIVPFIYPYHSSPDDYQRWTSHGLGLYFKDYTIIKQGAYAGPVAALQGVLMHLFAIFLSFGNEKLYIIFTNFFRILLSPLKIFDLLFSRLPYAQEISATIYFFGKKRKTKSLENSFV